MSGHGWDHKKDADRLARILEIMATAELDNGEWAEVRQALLHAWPARQDVADWTQPPRYTQVASVETEMDMEEM
jgi:hypothetical protein